MEFLDCSCRFIVITSHHLDNHRRYIFSNSEPACQHGPCHVQSNRSELFPKRSLAPQSLAPFFAASFLALISSHFFFCAVCISSSLFQYATSYCDQSGAAMASM